MVLRTLVKLTGPPKSSNPRWALPAISVPEIMHHFATVPVHFCSVVGGVVCVIYLGIMGTYKDTMVTKWKDFTDISPDARVNLLVTDEVAKLKEQKNPENRVQVKEGQKFED